MVADYLSSHLNVPAADCHTIAVGEDWVLLRQLIEGNTAAPARDRILAIIADPALSVEQRESALRYVADGTPWQWLCNEVFPTLRRVQIDVTLADTRVITNTICEKPIPAPVVEEPVVEVEETVTETVLEPAVPADTVNIHHLWLKTNIPAWGMLWMNIAAEYELRPHLTVALSVYHSPYNYFKSTRKFRTLTFMPELRYFPKSDNSGFFVSPHFGIAWYNAAFDGDYRYQDHDGNTPAIGGGISLGYRHQLSHNGRWHFEVSAGFGIYHLDYDLFDNVHNGQVVDRRKRTFYGLDNAALSLIYRFDIKKKGGNK